MACERATVALLLVPTLGSVSFNGKLYMAFRANESSGRIYYSSSSNGTTWTRGKTVNSYDSTRTTPVLASF